MKILIPNHLAPFIAEITEIAQTAADKAATDALNEIAEWLHNDRNNPDLACLLLRTFGAPSEQAQAEEGQQVLDFTGPVAEAFLTNEELSVWHELYSQPST